MPSKGRWALNPRRWFGTVSDTTLKRDKIQINHCVTPAPIRVILATTPTLPRYLAARNKVKVMPTSNVNDNNNNKTSANTFESFAPSQIPIIGVRREKSSTLFNYTNALLSTGIEPAIRKNVNHKEEPSIETTQWYTKSTVFDISKSFVLPSLISKYENVPAENSCTNQSSVNISDQSLMNNPQNSSNNSNEICPSSTRSHASFSTDDNDENDESSSGIFTDERADFNDYHRTTSKDTLSTADYLSTGSINDPQTSSNHRQFRPLVCPYRLSMSKLETVDNTKSSQLQHQTQTPIIRSNRPHSAEGILTTSQINTPTLPKSRQPSAVITKKLEKRIPTSRSPSVTLEKSGFVRIANDTYRLTMDKYDHLYHRHRQNSITEYSNTDDSLPRANDEESYARLPRTSSTEQLNNNLQTNLRAIADNYLRPMITSINQTSRQSTKTHHRSKRSHTNNEHTQIDIEQMTDKLLSSIDCSIYAQYQRCY